MRLDCGSRTVVRRTQTLRSSSRSSRATADSSLAIASHGPEASSATTTSCPRQDTRASTTLQPHSLTRRVSGTRAAVGCGTAARRRTTFSLAFGLATSPRRPAVAQVRRPHRLCLRTGTGRNTCAPREPAITMPASPSFPGITPRVRLHGSLCAIVTPFDADGALDLPAFGRLLDLHVAAGTHGVVVAGSTGESAALDEAEFQRLLEYAIAHVRG